MSIRIPCLFISENNIPMGANRWKDKLFISVPRRRLGVPSTLNYVSIKSKRRHNVPLIPYPDYNTNAMYTSQTRENRFVSIYRVAVDSCDRLWFVDTGVIEIPGKLIGVSIYLSVNILIIKECIYILTFAMPFLSTYI